MESLIVEVGADRSVIIPEDIYEKLGLALGDRLAFVELFPGQIMIKKVDAEKYNDIFLIDTAVKYNANKESQGSEDV